MMDSRIVADCASSQFLCGSSMISKSPPTPVMPPPAPAVRMPPPSFVCQSFAAVVSPRNRVHVFEFCANSSRTRQMRPKNCVSAAADANGFLNEAQRILEVRIDLPLPIAHVMGIGVHEEAPTLLGCELALLSEGPLLCRCRFRCHVPRHPSFPI